MPDEATMLDKILDHYVEQFDQNNIDAGELESIKGAIRTKILSESLYQIEADQRRKVDEEIKSYRRKALRKLNLTIIIETILIAFAVGIVVNQVTALIPEEYCAHAIVLGVLVCVIFVILLLVKQDD